MRTNPKIEWAEDFIPQGSRYYNWVGALEKLRERPNVWAKLATYKVRQSASTMICSLRRRYPEYEFERHETAIFARYPTS